ncbi:vWA domain-containing protein [Flavobacterium aciduliphilum]|uniref:Uncharacterized protein YegL n=1 Tax=Flavobacterium aciduliphilum TaxID=1101402 RepID=A0A328YQ53_9FLAO|nr:vWA domain-containing protein [Flavobacterium aciduliphilum]RAR75760.1 uncharacterized protein YegL [Flavobacterium aciduliphilum]
MKNKKTLYHFVLDSSGSMNDCVEATIKGFNNQLETIKSLQKELPKQEFRISLTLFNNHINHVLSNVSVSNFEPLSRSKYVPCGSTSLLDAIGQSINQIRINCETEIVSNKMNVVMIILTDGMENSSCEFNFNQIAKTITELETSGNWVFTFLGADIDAFQMSEMLNIRSENVVSFDKKNMDAMMGDISKGICYYSYSNDRFKKNFFDFIEEDEDQKGK